VLAGLTRRESACPADAWPYVSAVEHAKYTITHYLHHPQQAQTERYAKPVQDFNHNLSRLEPLYLYGFRNLQVVHHHKL
jgi:hypothetical protein